MRDLLYLSESKMQVLVPQLRGGIRRRLGLEAGANIGFVSFKATLPGKGDQKSPMAFIDAVVRMIEKHRKVRNRTDSGLASGDWIRFNEEFRYGDASSLERFDGDVSVPPLTYFVAAEPPPLVLCGSTAHVLDRRQSRDQEMPDFSHAYYSNAFLRYVQAVFESTSENAPGKPKSSRRHKSDISDISWSIKFIYNSAQDKPGWSDPVRLAGHARILAVGAAPAGEPLMLATPLYVEYSTSKSTRSI